MFGKFSLLFITLVVAVLATDEDLWNEFKSKHSKDYGTPEEEARRFGIFKDNLRQIEEHNKKYDNGEVTYKLGVNQFTDLTHDEFKEKHTGGYVRGQH